MHLLIRADGNSDIGFGHLYRSNSAAEEILAQGHQVTYATTTPDQVKAVCSDAVDVVQLESRTDVNLVLQQLLQSVDAVLIDSYTADRSYQQAIRDVVPVILISDDTRHAVCADAVVNGNLYATDLDYDFVETEPRWYLGTEYLLLRQSIRQQLVKEPPWRNSPERALVTMGGSDLRERTSSVIKAFDGRDLYLDVIIGPGFSDSQEQKIRRVANCTSTDARPVRNPDDLPQRMFQADFAVSSASTTTYELLGLGTPIVSLPVVDNQQLIASALRERDAATVLERNSGMDTIGDAIDRYLSDDILRKKRRELGRSLIDGRGAERVVDAIQKLVCE